MRGCAGPPVVVLLVLLVVPVVAAVGSVLQLLLLRMNLTFTGWRRSDLWTILIIIIMWERLLLLDQEVHQ